MGGDWVGGAEGVYLHGLKTFPQKEVILGERKCVYTNKHTIFELNLERQK